jgi:hypothetical protein
MPDVTLRIKNLSISLEALSRINTEGSGSLYVEIETLLREAIKEAEEENKRPPPVRPTGTANDNDIPF